MTCFDFQIGRSVLQQGRIAKGIWTGCLTVWNHLKNRIFFEEGKEWRRRLDLQKGDSVSIVYGQTTEVMRNTRDVSRR